jgi:hypothetical protein
LIFYKDTNIEYSNGGQSSRTIEAYQKISENKLITAKNRRRDRLNWNLIPNRRKGNGIGFQNRLNEYNQNRNNQYNNRYNNRYSNRIYPKTNNISIKSTVPRVLVLTYFRSGSSFLGDLLQQNPNSFYLFEPFQYLSSGIRMYSNRSEEVINIINNIFRCELKNLREYIKWMTNNWDILIRNNYLWSVCGSPKVCSNRAIVDNVCNRSLLQIMKMTTFRMRYLENLLPKLNDLNFHVVYLVRDPRGIIVSRDKFNYSSDLEENLNISNLCAEMREDLNYFRKFQTLYPQNFTLIRFEDLSIDPFSNAKLLYNRIGIPFTEKVKSFINGNTNINSTDERNENPYENSRNSRKIAYGWISSLNRTFNIKAKDICRDILKEFKYHLIDSI